MYVVTYSSIIVSRAQVLWKATNAELFTAATTLSRENGFNPNFGEVARRIMKSKGS
jgi:hypothetical protein